jgi:hypothetical protein
MKIKPLSAVVALWCWLVCGLGAWAEPKFPRLSIPEPTYHFEPILQGQIVKHEFKLLNSGSSDLLIQKIVPGCGCTATKISKKIVPAGDETVISVEFNSAGFIGRKIRTISVETNDPKMPVVDLTLEGLIKTSVTVEPQALSFGELEIGDVATLELLVNKTPEANISIREVYSRNNSISVSKLSEDKARAMYSITLKGEGKLGGVRGLVNISLNDKGRTTVPVPFFATVVKPKS